MFHHPLSDDATVSHEITFLNFNEPTIPYLRELSNAIRIHLILLLLFIDNFSSITNLVKLHDIAILLIKFNNFVTKEWSFFSYFNL